MQPWIRQLMPCFIEGPITRTHTLHIPHPTHYHSLHQWKDIRSVEVYEGSLPPSHVHTHLYGTNSTFPPQISHQLLPTHKAHEKYSNWWYDDNCKELNCLLGAQKALREARQLVKTPMHRKRRVFEEAHELDLCHLLMILESRNRKYIWWKKSRRRW